MVSTDSHGRMLIDWQEPLLSLPGRLGLRVSNLLALSGIMGDTMGYNCFHKLLVILYCLQRKVVIFVKALS